MTTSVELRVFGPTRAFVAGTEVDLGGPRVRALLALLAGSGEDGVRGDAIVEAIWGEQAPPTARKSVQKYVSVIRSSLDRSVVVTTTDGYALDQDSVSIDVHAFEVLVEQAAHSLAEGNAAAALEASEGALALSRRGEAFADLAGSARHRPLSVRIAELAHSVAELRIEALAASGRDAEAIGAAEALVADHPLRERAWALLMQSLYRLGRQSEAVRAFRRLSEALAEIGLEPSPELRDLEQGILEQAPHLAERPPRPEGLPSSYTSFVGRDDEMRELGELFERARLITVLGPGGSGKTRLAVELVAGFGERSWFLDLARIEDPARVLASAVESFGIAGEPGEDPGELFRAHLGHRRALVILDNCEHVLGAAASLAHTVLQHAPQVTVVATSREPLGLTGESVYALAPLRVPLETVEDPEAAIEFGAVRLFVDRAEAADPGFSWRPVWTRVVEVCRRLDGIPLAIELAARQLAVMELDEVVAGLLDELGQLEAPGQPVPRHRTLEAAIEWSFALLDDRAQRRFAALSVFPGSFPRRAAERLWDELGVAGDASSLTALVAASMVVRSPHERESRYRLLEPMRAFGVRRGEEAFASEAPGRAHALWVLEELLEDPAIIGPDERATLARLRAEDHHFPVAMMWATEHDPELALRLTIAATSYLWMVDYRFTWFDELRRAIESGRAASPDLRAQALAAAAHSLAENFADHVVATAYATEALDHARTSGDVETELTAMLALASGARNAGHLAEAIELERETVKRADEVGADLWALRGTRWMAFAEMQRGNYETALALADDAQQRGDALGSDWVAAKSLWVAAAVLALQGSYAEAEARAARAFELFDGYDDPASPVHVRAVQGDAARLAGDVRRAAEIYEECLRGFQDVGDRRCTASTHRNLGLVSVHLGDLEAANVHLDAALDQRWRFGDEAGVAECVEALGLLRSAEGRPAEAIELLAAARVLRERSGSRPPEPERIDLETVERQLASELSHDESDEARRRGEALPDLEDLPAHLA